MMRPGRKGADFMADQKMRLDIRLVKFQDYIRKKPNSPFGYYGMGVQYMLSGKPALAERMFARALKIDADYVPAKLGRLEYLLCDGKFLAACRYYHKNSGCFSAKRIYLNRIQRVASRLYRTRSFYRQSRRLGSMLLFANGYGLLQRMFDNEPDNPVVNLLLAMFFLKAHSQDERARVVYNLCVRMEGIADKLRWDLLQALTKEQPGLLQDPGIAGLFSAIPESAVGSKYASFLLSTFIRQQDQDKALKAFSDLQKSHSYPDGKTLWKYLHFCRSNNLWSPSLTVCCQKLAGSGWIDSFLAGMVKELKNRGMAENTRELDKLLSLYGYL
jgi:tetratricopeptide (TPR) repeat protein